MSTQSKGERYLTARGWVFAYSYKPGFFGGARMWRDPETKTLHAQSAAISICRIRAKQLRNASKLTTA